MQGNTSVFKGGFVRLYLFAMLLAFSVQSNAQSILERLSPPNVGAHQGGYPWKGSNNTIAKFNQAIKDGADIIETDVRLLKDGVVVVFHDDKACRKEVRTLTLAEIRKCDRNVETFEDVLKNINGRAVVNAEFKIPEVAIAAIQLVKKYNAYDWVYFQTKAVREVYLNARKTDAKIALNYKALNNVEFDWALSQNDRNLIIIEMEKDMATPANIQKAHHYGKMISVNSWRYGSSEEFFSAACDKVFKLGIDVAIANNISGCVKQKNKIKQRMGLL